MSHQLEGVEQLFGNHDLLRLLRRQHFRDPPAGGKSAANSGATNSGGNSAGANKLHQLRISKIGRGFVELALKVLGYVGTPGDNTPGSTR